MKKYGLTKERYQQMLDFYNDDKEAVMDIVDDWGAEACNKGYDIFDQDGTGLLAINKIDDIGAFDTDEDAAMQAVKDGIKIIPINELPIDFDEKYYIWVDTEENRKAINDFCKKYYC